MIYSAYRFFDPPTQSEISSDRLLRATVFLKAENMEELLDFVEPLGSLVGEVSSAPFGNFCPLTDVDLEALMTVEFPSIESFNEPEPIVTPNIEAITKSELVGIHERERTPLLRDPSKDNSCKENSSDGEVTPKPLQLL